MALKKFDNTVDKWKQTKNKKIVFKNVDTKVDTKKVNIYNIFENYLNKSIDYDGINMIEKTIKDGIKIYQKRPRTDKNKRIINNSNKIINAIELFKSMIDNNEFVIPGEYNAKPNNNIDLDWMIDKGGYEEIAEEADSVYMKKSNGNELKLMKDFITKINNGSINNKNKAGNEFRKLKQKVTNDRLRQDLIKDLERYIFGEDIESIEPEEKYDESIAERVKIIIALAKIKLNTIDTLLSSALNDSKISHEDFTNVITEKNIYENIKENIKNTIEPTELPSIAELTTESSSLERTAEPITTL